MLAHTYIDRGTDVAILLLHGIVADHQQLRALHNLPYTIIAPDLPGHGDNAKITPKPILEGTAALIKELLDHHGITRYHIIGYSLGGYLALDLMGRGLAPEKLVLISSGYALPYQEQLRRHNIIEKALPLVKTNEQLIQRLIDAYRDYLGIIKKSIKGRLDIDTAVAYLQAIAEEDLKASCTRYKGRALVIHGTGDFIIPKSIGEAAAKALPHAETVYLKTDHNRIVSKAEMRRAVEKFLSSDR